MLRTDPRDSCRAHSSNTGLIRPAAAAPDVRHRRDTKMITRWLTAALLLQPATGLAKGGFATAKPKKKTKKAPKAPKPLEPLPPGLDGVPPVSRFEVLNADGVAPQFAGAFLIEDESVADDLVKEFHERPQLRGMVSNAANGEPVVDTSVKDSLEMSFPANDPSIAWRRYLLSLKAAMGLYLEDYPYAGAYGAFSITGRTNVQLYPPSGGYKTFHTERTGKGEPEGSRHLVFMTYLNDMTDAGADAASSLNLERDVDIEPYAIDARRLHYLMKWVVSFPILSRFGPRRDGVVPAQVGRSSATRI